MRSTYFAFFLLFLLAVSCKPKIEEQAPTAGEIDPTRFVMIGGAETSGFMDDALFYEGQVNSLAAIIAKQLEKVGGSAFYQPLIAPNSVGVNVKGQSKFILNFKTDCKGVSALSPLRSATSGDLSIWNDQLYQSSKPFGNFGIPGFFMSEANNTSYSTQNNYFKRMASSPSASVMGDVMATNATFFSLFTGMEELLDHAKSGAKNQTLLSPAQFESMYAPIVDQLVSNGANGVLATLPDPTVMPFFTTIPYNGLNLDEESAETLNQIYNPIGISFSVGPNPFVINDPSAGAFGVRLMQEGEMILLSVPLDSVKCYKMGSVFPLRDEFVLTLAEIATIKTNTNAYNQVIVAQAAAKGLALADVRPFYNSLVSGITYNGIQMSAKFVSGGAYSLDGINLNPRGNAMLANVFIKSMNEFYKAKIPFANPISYRGNIFP